MNVKQIFKPKCLKISLVVLSVSMLITTNLLYRSYQEDVKIFKKQYSKALAHCLANKHNQKRDKTELIEGYKSYPCNKELYAKKCKKCAYVTGSGHLLGSKKGEEIDSHDCVFRSNCAPIVGYEEDVGYRTDYRTVNHLSVHDMLQMLNKDGMENFDMNTVNHTIFLGYQMTWHGEEPEIIKLMPEYKNVTFYITEEWKLNELLDLFHKEVGPTTFTLWMSNGFVSLMLMRDFCEEIHVYGIADEYRCEKIKNGEEGYVDAPYHYYGFLGLLETECWRFWRHGNGIWGHQYIKEKTLFRKWVNEWKNLYFHAPEWSY